MNKFTRTFLILLILLLGGYGIYHLGRTHPPEPVPLRPPQKIRETTRIVMTASESQPLLFNRWYPSVDGRGMTARDGASLLFYRFLPESDLSVQITCWITSQENMSAGGFELQLNDHSLGLFSPDDQSRVEAVLPLSKLNPIENRLSFHAVRDNSGFPLSRNAVNVSLLEFASDDLNVAHQTDEPAGYQNLPPGTGLCFRALLPADGFLTWVVPETNGDLIAPQVWMSELGGSFRKLNVTGDTGKRRFYAKPGNKTNTLADIYLLNPKAQSQETASPNISIASPQLLSRKTLPHSDINILLVVIDTLRADYVSCYNPENARTPNIDALASTGIRFTKAFSHIPITGPSHTTLFTSRYGSDAGVTNNGQVLPLREFCLAEAMQYTGRSTYGGVSLAVLKKAFEFSQGFDVYDQDMGPDFQVPADEVTRRFIQQLDYTTPPFFAFLHYSDPHEPYLNHGASSAFVRLERNGELLGQVDIASQTTLQLEMELQPGENVVRLTGEKELRLRSVVLKPADLGLQSVPGIQWKRLANGTFIATEGEIRIINPGSQSVRANVAFILSEVLSLEEMKANYAREVEFVDVSIGNLVQSLKDRGLYDKTLIILTSDHGEGLGDHDLLGHIDQLYDSLLHIPLIIRFPDGQKSGSVSEIIVSWVDIMPTVLDYLVMSPPRPVRGNSLMPLILDRRFERQELHFAETWSPEAPLDKIAFRSATRKFIFTPGINMEELYDLNTDPGELMNVADTDTRNLVIFKKIMELHLKSPLSDTSSVRSKGQAMDDETREQLQTLGYVHK